MSSAATTADHELIALRQQANYWRAQHTRAVERERILTEEKRQLLETVRQLQERVAKLEGLEQEVAFLRQQLFGRKSERSGPPARSAPQAGPAQDGPPTPGRKRGQQPGAKGHGRKRHPDLPTEEMTHSLPADAQHCPQCGKPFDPFPGTQDSEEIEWDVHVFRRVHKRERYTPTCTCGAVPGIVTAPGPAKLIPKGKFSTGFWVHLLLDKFLFQLPLHRIRQMLALEGLSVSQGTLTGGLKRVHELLQPLYAAILERSRQAEHWHMDETRWMVFAELAGKIGHRWWLWVVATCDTCAFLLAPTRSSKVPREHLGDDAQGTLNVDRYAAYKALGDQIELSFCWSHVRRDFERIRDGHPKLASWADGWVARINGLFHLNKRRLAVRSQPEAFEREDQALRAAVADVANTRDAELADASLHEAQRKALVSLQNHWDGLIVFVDNPDIPMDNNESERALRGPVVGRKNYYGSGSIWSGMLTAVVFTLFQTLVKNSIDPKRFLLAYFEACAQNGGRPPVEVDSFLPWNLTDLQREAWRTPDKPP